MSPAPHHQATSVEPDETDVELVIKTTNAVLEAVLAITAGEEFRSEIFMGLGAAVGTLLAEWIPDATKRPRAASTMSKVILDYALDPHTETVQ